MEPEGGDVVNEGSDVRGRRLGGLHAWRLQRVGLSVSAAKRLWELGRGTEEGFEG